jgi:hypothetical protein
MGGSEQVENGKYLRRSWAGAVFIMKTFKTFHALTQTWK